MLVLCKYDREQFQYSMALNGENLVRKTEHKLSFFFFFSYLQGVCMAFLQERSEKDTGEFVETVNWQSKQC